MVRRRNNNITKSLKDYIVPIIGLLLIILLIYSIFSGGDENGVSDKIKYENQIPLNVKEDSELTESYIIYPGESKKEIETEVDLYKQEKVMVKEGSVSINFETIGGFALGKLGELKYLENGDLSLTSGKMWINSKSKVNVDMKYAKVLIGDKSHVSLDENEMGSTVYLLSGEAEVRNIAGKSTVLAPGQKIYISRQDSNNSDLDLSLSKEELDDFFKTSDWYIKNNGNLYLLKTEEDITGSGSKLEEFSGKNLIILDNLKDESYVSSSNLNITGKYIDETISKIILNNTQAKINKTTKTFNFDNFVLDLKENNLVFKIYDDSNDLIQKFVYVVYYEGGNANSGNNLFQVKNYSVDGSKFTFTSPSTTGNFTTTAGFVTIKGNVLAKGIAKVSVNDYVLSSFNGSTWRYHANVDYDNLKEGTNIYEIKYFDVNGKIVYTHNYTIIKKPITSSTTTKPPEKKEEKKYSDEVTLN